MAEVTVLVDIDGVLAKHNTRCLLSTYAKNLKLSIPDEQLADVHTREAFHLLPQVQEYIAGVGRDHYQKQLARLEWHPRYVEQCLVIRDALAGVQYLATQASDLGYCTARVISFHERWNRDLALATHLWLTKQGFPNARQVLFCDGFRAKLEAVAAHLREQQDAYIMLIDDSADKLLRAYEQLTEADQCLLRERFTLVGFWFEEDVDHPLHTVPLADWERVQQLEKEFNYATLRRTEQKQPQQR